MCACRRCNMRHLVDRAAASLDSCGWLLPAWPYLCPCPLPGWVETLFAKVFTSASARTARDPSSWTRLFGTSSEVLRRCCAHRQRSASCSEQTVGRGKPLALELNTFAWTRLGKETGCDAMHASGNNELGKGETHPQLAACLWLHVAGV